jgi:phenylacetate-CoA ligase
MTESGTTEQALPLSVLSGIHWPSISDPPGALALAMQYQLERTEWLAPAVIEQQQCAQLSALFAHAYASSAFWHERLGQAGYVPDMPVTRAWLERMPVLTRRELQSQAAALTSVRAPREHGQVYVSNTSGSTGTPVECLSTDATDLIYRSITLREYLWQQRDFSAKLVAIRPAAATQRLPGWGSGIEPAYATGPLTVLNPNRGTAQLLDDLLAEDPTYLVANPSLVQDLALASLRGGQRPARLRQVRTVGEMLPDDLRELVAEAWKATVADTYSAVEVGYMALQCPNATSYHVQSESVLLEVLDEQGAPCAAGETGRVVVTALHNYARPLLRYEIGDYAEVGAPCQCGRGLPVLRRIMGRRRNMCTLPDGRRIWPIMAARQWRSIAPIIQCRVVQKTPRLIEAHIVAERGLSDSERAEFVRRTARRLSETETIEIQVREVRSIDRAPGEKFEDFVSEIAD